MYKSILLAADGSDNSYRAAEESLKVIDKAGKVTILNVLDPEESKREILHSSASESLLSKKKEKLSRITDLYDEEGIDYEVRLERGVANETVVKISNSGDYDAVILGTRGLNSLQEMVLGSVSHKVAKRSDITVIIVK
ncbi:MAG TPA: universal stress protein [Candidatus Salinicoccus merdavium]|nr:universal stress protein [Candidatus Salinicoccus merdavium]